MNSPNRLGVLAVPMLALIWGMNWPAVRAILSWWSPWALRALGLGIGAALLFALAKSRATSLQVPRTQWLRLIVSSLLTIVGFNLCTAFAQMSGTTSRAAIVTFTMPVWAVLFAWPVLDEKPDSRRLLAVLTGCVGLVLLSVPSWHGATSPLGGLFALGAGLSWAAGTVFVKRYPIAAPPLASTAWQLALGAVAAVVGGLLSAQFNAQSWTQAFFTGIDPPFTTAAFVGAMLFHIVLANAFAYLIWFDVVMRLPASVAALGTLLVPVVGVTGAMTVLGERPGVLDLTGFALIVCAAALALLPGAHSVRR